MWRLWTTLVVSLCGPIALLPGLVRAEEPLGKKRVLGEIKHEAVEELPLPRDRNDFGIGEQIFFWMERPASKATDRHEVGHAVELAGFVIWTVSDTSTLLPTITRIGDRTIVRLGYDAGEFIVDAVELDPTKSIDNHSQNWEPAEPAFGPLSEHRSHDRGQTLEEDDDEDDRQATDWKRAWNQKRYRLMALQQGRTTPFVDVEGMARELFAEPLSEAEQALVYFHLAEIYAQSGMIHPDRVLEYSRRALARPLTPIQRTTLSIYRGDACLARRTNETFAERRRAAAFEYLCGLGEIARHDLPAAAPERRRIDLLDSGDEEEERAHAKMVKEAVAFNARVKFQATLIQHRMLLGQQLQALYFSAR